MRDWDIRIFNYLKSYAYISITIGCHQFPLKNTCIKMQPYLGYITNYLPTSGSNSPMNLPEAIKEVMLENGLSYYRLANVMGLSLTTVTRTIGKDANPTISTLEKYARCMGVKVSYIISKAEAL